PQEVPETLRTETRDRVVDLEGAAQADHLLRGVVPLHASPARGGRPLGLELVGEFRDPLFPVEVDHLAHSFSVGSAALDGSGGKKRPPARGGRPMARAAEAVLAPRRWIREPGAVP